MGNTARYVTVVILAAGMGKRMNSDQAKVLQKILGKPMVLYVVETAQKVGNEVITVIGNQADKVREVISQHAENIKFAFQDRQLGTAHAVMCALKHISDDTGHVLILCGDVPLIRPATISRLLDDHLGARRDLSLLAVEMDNPSGYGRVLFDENRQLCGIVEEADATEGEKNIKTINTGIYCVKKDFLFRSLAQITTDNVQGEFYLTDIVKIGFRGCESIGLTVAKDYREVMGVNTLEHLLKVETLMRDRLQLPVDSKKNKRVP
ncbi:MAG: NTP transferase domain-containing protein [Desulfobacterales bacterium]|nr:NTP transferase domain-containing protein [Desulfobacterales bacterium]